MREWSQSRIQKEYLDTGLEEGQQVDYKAASALAQVPSRKTEIRRDVSAFANAAGGLVFYGIREKPKARSDPGVPDAFDPILDKKLTKEWLEQVLNGIDPRIPGLLVHSVPLAPDGRIYVVVIPQGLTAHQTDDGRYYRRYGSETLWMHHHEVLDVLHRSTVPDADVQIAHKRSPGGHDYQLEIRVVNTGMKVINNFKLVLRFPDLPKIRATGREDPNTIAADHPYLTTSLHFDTGIQTSWREPLYRCFSLPSATVLFPEDSWSFAKTLTIKYTVDQTIYGIQHRIPPVKWTLYADDMSRKTGETAFSELHDF